MAKEYRVSNRYIWHKKTIVMYVLSILVFWIDCSSFSNYNNISVLYEYISMFFQQVITPVAVPLFFIISGAVFFRDYENIDTYKRKLKSRVMTLLVPYLYWNTINMLFQILCSQYFSEYFIGREVFEYSIENILKGIFLYKYNIPFWYILALMAFAVCAPVINWIIRNKYVAFGTIAVLILLYGAAIGIRSDIIYYMVGAVIGKHYYEKFSYVSTQREVKIGIWGCIFSCAYELATIKGWIVKISAIDVLVLILYSFSLWNMLDPICKKVRSYTFLKHSFWVYALHVNVGAVVAKLFYLSKHKKKIYALPNFVVTTIVTLVLIEFICEIIMTLSPKMFKTLSGDRMYKEKRRSLKKFFCLK